MTSQCEKSCQDQDTSQFGYQKYELLQVPDTQMLLREEVAAVAQHNPEREAKEQFGQVKTLITPTGR